MSHKSKETQDQIKVISIEGFDKKEIFEASPTKDKLQSFEKNRKKKMKTNFEKKVQNLCNDLLQQQSFFEETLRLIKDEEDELQKNLDQLEKGTSVANLHRNFAIVLMKSVENRQMKSIMKEFFKVVCDLKEKGWQPV